MFILDNEKITKLFKSYRYYDGFFDQELMEETGILSNSFYHNEEQTKILVLSDLSDGTYLIHIMKYDEDYGDVEEEHIFKTLKEALEFIKTA